MKMINTHEAKTHLSRLLDRVARGEDIIIARAGKPIARLSAYDGEEDEREGGQWKGLVHMQEDFEAPLPDEIARPFSEPS